MPELSATAGPARAGRPPRRRVRAGPPVRAAARRCSTGWPPNARALRDRGPALGRPLDARVPLLAAARPARRTPAARLHLPQRRAAPPPSAAPVPGRGGAPRGGAAPRARALLAAPSSPAQVAGILGASRGPGAGRAPARALRGQRASSPRSCSPPPAARRGPLPPSLRDVLDLRLEALPEDARAVLRVAAAAGRHAGHRLLAAVTDLPEPALLDALRAAVPTTCSSTTATATPSATPCSRRPPTPTCSPASGPRCTWRSPRP